MYKLFLSFDVPVKQKPRETINTELPQKEPLWLVIGPKQTARKRIRILNLSDRTSLGAPTELNSLSHIVCRISNTISHFVLQETNNHLYKHQIQPPFFESPTNISSHYNFFNRKSFFNIKIRKLQRRGNT